MLDFIKNNKLISGAVVLMVLMILAIIMILFLARGAAPEPEERNPFGNTDTERPLTTDSGNEFLFGTSSERFVPEGAVGTVVPDFRAVTNIPVIGATVYEQNENGKLVEYVRFTARTNGHVFDTPLATLGEEKNVSSKTILRIGDTKWSRNGSSTISRYFDEGGTQMFAYISHATYGTSTTEGVRGPVEFEGRPVVETIQDVALSPQGDELFYLVTDGDGSKGYVENVVSGARTEVWSSLLRNLSVSWETPNRILIYSNPSSYADGAVWSLDPNTKTTSVLMGDHRGLAAKTNGSGSKILYSLEESENNIFSLRILTLGTGDTTTLPLATIIEKCAWGPAGSKYVYCAIPRQEPSATFLEDWYMGLVSSDDVLWRLDTETGVVKKLIDPMEVTNEKFDIVDILVSPQEDFVLFKTRVNSVLWALKLPEKISVSTNDEDGTTDTEE